MFEDRLTYSCAFEFPSKEDASVFFKALEMYVRRSWDGKVIRVFMLGDKSRMDEIEKLAAKYKGETNGDWSERYA
jgi:hypothetical protein